MRELSAETPNALAGGADGRLRRSIARLILASRASRRALRVDRMGSGR